VEEAVDGLDLRQERETRAFVRTAGRLALYSVECPTDSIRESVAGDAEDDSTSLLRTILRITALWQVGRMRDVEVEIENFSSLWERVKRPSAAWYVRMLRATMALMKGQYELSSELAQQYLRQGLAVDDRNAIHSFALQRAMWAIDVGNMEELEPAVIDMATRFPRVEGWLAGVCYLYTELGKMAEARDAMDRAIGQGVLNSYPRNSWFGTLCSLTLACRVIESPAVVDQLYSLLERFAGQMAVVGFSSFCWGSTDRFLGILAGLMRKWNVSDAHFRRAIAINRAAGAWPALAHTYADLGSMLNRRLPGSGQEASNLALEQTRSMGMVNLERRILQNL
jgi:hypothetical protein